MIKIIEFNKTIKLKENAMLRVRPDLFYEWDFEKNNELGLDIYKVTKSKDIVAWWKCKKHKSYKQSIRSKVSSKGCKICNSRELLVGFNDMWTTNPELAKLLNNPEDGYKYMQFSKHRVDWKCPNCKETIKNKRIKDINLDGLSCPYCSDGISYGEKVVSNLLKILNIDFECQKTFSWAKNKRYDFYLPAYNTIIEVHGKQHKNGGFKTFKNGKTLSEEKENDTEKYNLAKNNDINKYIVIDALESNIYYLQNSIHNSELCEMFDLSNVNWTDIEKETQSSMSFKCLELWNNGTKDIKKISEELGIHKEMVRRYLKRWAKIEKCDYYNQRKNTTKIVQLDSDFNFIKQWNSITEASKYYTGKSRNAKLTKALNGTENSVFGYRWMYEDAYKNFLSTGKIETNTTENSNSKKSVVKLSLEGEYIETYSSLTEAGIKNNIKSYSHITSCCRGRRKHCGGYKWMYLEDFKKQKNKNKIN